MGERFELLVKATAFCIVVWTVLEIIVRLLGKISEVFGIDEAIIANAILIILLCLGGWFFLKYMDSQKPDKK